MTTSDQQGNLPLTRKQLREIRLTGSTPVITEDEAAAAQVAAAAAPSSPPEIAHVTPAPQGDADVDSSDAPLTRRRVRQQEQIRTGSTPVTTQDAPEADVASDVPSSAERASDEELAEVEPVADESVSEDLVVVDDDDDVDEDVVDVTPVSAADTAAEAAAEADTAVDDADDELLVAEPVVTGERPIVSPTFGQGLISEQSDVPTFSPSFDDLITSGSGGSQNLAPNTLIFTPSAGERSLSGPVASTGEVLVTGSYELPQGIGSQGHAHGAADGKEADAVLIDGELPSASSPTPIAASAAISTIKPAGEVIRPPAPEKGNKLMLILAITAGGLALVLAAALVIAFTMNVLS